MKRILIFAERVFVKRIFSLLFFVMLFAVAQTWGQARPFITKWRLEKGSFYFPLLPDKSMGYHFYKAMCCYPEGGSKEAICAVVNDFSPPYIRIPEDGVYIVEIPADEIKRLEAQKLFDGQLLSVEQWGDCQWRSLNNAFAGCYNMTISPEAGTPDLRKVESLSGMFRGCKKMNSPLNHWDVGGIKYMDKMFYEAESFNQPLDLWDVRQVLRMDSMFYKAKSFNQNLGKWELGENVCLGLQRCGMDVENFSNTLYAWKPYYRTHQMRRIKATGLYYNEKGRVAKDTLESHRYYWDRELWFHYDIDGARYLSHYVLFRKPEFVARVGEESLLKLTSGGLDDDDWAQVELEVEDENILEVVDAKTLKIKGLEAGTTKVTLHVPEKDDVHKDLEASCTVTVKPSNKKLTTTPAATPAKKKGSGAKGKNK